MRPANRTIVAFAVLALGGYARATEPLQLSAHSPQPSKISARFLYALAMVESSGNPDTPAGDGGRAVGLYQIHDIYRREANRLAGTKYVPSDRADPRKAGQMVAIVLTHWAKYHARRGVPMGPAEICSLHRQPNHKWTPARMDTPLERGRTQKLYNYLKQN